MGILGRGAREPNTQPSNESRQASREKLDLQDKIDKASYEGSRDLGLTAGSEPRYTGRHRSDG